MPTRTGETDQAETAERAPESNSVRFSESQRDADRVRGGDGGDSSDRPERGDRGDSAERTVLGDPDRLAEHWEYQGQTRDCALYSEKSVAGGFGRSVDLEQHREAGKAEETYSADGTTLDGVGRVLEREGIKVDRYEMNTEDKGFGGEPVKDHQEAVAMRDQAVADGKGVITVVDSGTLWGQEPGYHALHVTGIEISKDGERFIVTNDSGVPDGAAKHYPADRFDEAWADAGHKMVITTDRMPDPEDR
jgi:hypothetical protein